MSNAPSQFDREPPATKTASQTSKSSATKKRYQAFATAGKPVPYMEILYVMQPSQAPQSRFLMATVFSTDCDTSFTLIYSYMAVEVKGHNLKEVRRAIQNGRCEFIQEWHDNEFIRPSKDAPVIESVRFIVGDKLDDILSPYRGKE